MVSEAELKKKVIGIVGLGYVGCPLAEEFSQHFKVIGFDINQKKVDKLRSNGYKFEVTADPTRLKEADFVIIAVPTPVTKSKQPNLAPVVSAAEIVGKHMKKGAIVVLESTVYPGVSEEIMAPTLEKSSGMKLGKDFKIGYSPERVNPGDTEHTIGKITKVVSGMDEESTTLLSQLYGKITNVYPAENIRVAEAAKVIENIQRDLNIALMNELSIIFHKMNIDTRKVLDAASTKWNFVRFAPGLVGGHCIPVDPYYLVYRANELGYHPQVILAGRSINDYMPKHVVELTVKALNEARKVINGSKILIMGLTFKENVDDTRETPVQEIIAGLREFNCDLYGFDPLLTTEQISGFGVTPTENLAGGMFDGVIVTVGHDQFKKYTVPELEKIMGERPIIVDVRGFLSNNGNNGVVYKTL